MKRLMNMYEQRMKQKGHGSHFKFKFKSQWISGDDTVKELGLKEWDKFFAFQASDAI